MSQPLLWFASAVVCVALGAGAGFLVARALMAARLASAQQRVGELERSLQQEAWRAQEASQRLQEEAIRRAAAEERAARIGDLEAELAAVMQERDGLLQRATHLEARLEEERRVGAEKLALLEDAKAKLADAFKALSTDVLQASTQSFIQLAQAHLQTFQQGAIHDLEARQQRISEMVKPLIDSLSRVDAALQQLERQRTEAYASLSEQVRALHATEERLRSETSRLVQALKAPTVRGRWGEIQLRRVVELAGMVPYCDFEEQPSVTTAEGRLRPDLVVRLPGGKRIVVDAKAPLDAYLKAVESTDEEERASLLRLHAEQIRKHMKALGAKSYWDQFQPSPEFVVLFLPGETFFSAALERDPSLIELGVAERVIPASPTTLIALLRAVAYGWQQERIAESAQQVSVLGRELHDRLAVMVDHLARLGRALDGALDAYNSAVGSLESRVLVSARRFKELTGSSKEIEPLSPVERSRRPLTGDVGSEAQAALPGDSLFPEAHST